MFCEANESLIIHGVCHAHHLTERKQTTCFKKKTTCFKKFVQVIQNNFVVFGLTEFVFAVSRFIMFSLFFDITFTEGCNNLAA